jgi:hypothetical protein
MSHVTHNLSLVWCFEDGPLLIKLKADRQEKKQLQFHSVISLREGAKKSINTRGILDDCERFCAATHRGNYDSEYRSNRGGEEVACASFELIVEQMDGRLMVMNE